MAEGNEMADKVDVLDLLDRAQSAMDYTQAAREAAQSCGVLPGDFRHLRTAIAELIAAVQDERILRDLGADVDSKTLASAMRRTSAALRNCRASTLTGAAQ